MSHSAEPNLDFISSAARHPLWLREPFGWPIIKCCFFFVAFAATRRERWTAVTSKLLLCGSVYSAERRLSCCSILISLSALVRIHADCGTAVISSSRTIIIYFYFFRWIFIFDIIMWLWSGRVYLGALHAFIATYHLSLEHNANRAVFCFVFAFAIFILFSFCLFVWRRRRRRRLSHDLCCATTNRFLHNHQPETRNGRKSKENRAHSRHHPITI